MSKASRRLLAQLARVKEVPVASLLTAAGPAPGTTWKRRDGNETFTIDRLEGGRVFYKDSIDTDSAADFVEAINTDHVIPILES